MAVNEVKLNNMHSSWQSNIARNFINKSSFPTIPALSEPQILYGISEIPEKKLKDQLKVILFSCFEQAVVLLNVHC